jgi:predicted HTH transcriptional regulator
LIANPLYLAGYAERLGTGTADITKQCLAIGLKPPSFSQTDNFRTIFWRNVETLNENPATLNENSTTLRPNLETLKPNLETLRDNLETLEPLQGLPKRMSREALEEIILTLCSEEYLTVNQISRLIGKSSAYLLNEIIPYLVDNQRLIRLFPATPNHQNQAYKTNQV